MMRAGNLDWPHEGIAVRVPPRRLAATAPPADAAAASGAPLLCEIIAFKGALTEAPRIVSWDELARVIPAGARIVLLVAAEDVLFTTADVPPLSGARLREALPNLVEERTVGEVGSLHVAAGGAVGGTDARGSTEGMGSAARGARGIRGVNTAQQVLAVVDRNWLSAMQTRLVSAGRRVAAILPEALCVPGSLASPRVWTLAAVADPNHPARAGSISVEARSAARLWLRTDAQQAFALPDDLASAVAIASAIFAHASSSERPAAIECVAELAQRTEAARVGAAIASAIAVPLREVSADPFAAWLAGGGPGGAFGAPLSLSDEDAGANAFGARNLVRWRLAALLLVAIFGVQAAGMQWQWASLRREAAALRDRATATLKASFPETRVVLDAPLQMSRNLAALRAQAGRSDPADFSVMLAASAQIFSELPSNALRALDYETRTLRIRFAPGMVAGGEGRDKLISRAAQAGYVLNFESASNPATNIVASVASGETSASLRWKGGA